MSSSSQYPAIRGTLGSTEYYTVVIKAKELAEKTRLESPDDWEKQTVDEIIQRKLNYTRVVKHIAPYLTGDKDRFFGAVIISLTSLNPPEFTALPDLLVGQKINPMFKPFQPIFKDMGLLILSGSEMWSPMDGQHRIAALRAAITGKDHKGKIIEAITASTSLPNEDVNVILIHSASKAKVRKIFVKVNRSAIKISKGEGLLIDDDNIIAVIARSLDKEIGSGKLIGILKADNETDDEKLVSVLKADIGDNEAFFTTLSALAQTTEHILRYHMGEKKIDTTTLPDKDKQSLYKKKVHEVWRHLATHIKLFKNALAKPGEDGDKQRKELRKSYLLLKPVPQVAMVTAFARLTGQNQGAQPMAFNHATDRLNKIDWKRDNPAWDRVFMSGGKVNHRSGKLGAQLIYYMAGGKLKDGEEAEILKKYQELFPPNERDSKKLPPKVA